MENSWQIGRSQYQMKWTFILWCSLAYYVERVRKAVADVVIFDCWPWRKPLGCLKVLAGTWQNDAKHLGFVAAVVVVVVVVVVAHCFLSKWTHATLATLSQPSKKANWGCKKRNKNNMFHSHLKVSHPNGMATIFNSWRWSIAATLKCCNTQMPVSLEREFANT